MSHTITARNEDGTPAMVLEDDGFCQHARPYDPDKDAWIEDQLDPREFDTVVAGREMEALIHEVNALRRENFRLRRDEEQYRTAFFERM